MEGKSDSADAAMPADRFLRASGRCYRGLDPAVHGPDAERVPFHFVQMADPQLGMESQFKKGLEGWEQELQLMSQAAEEINRIRPAFCVVCGDLVDEFPSEERDRTKGCDESRRIKQEADFKDAMQKIDPSIPLMCLCGNHDIGNRPNSLTIKRYTDSFGDDYFSFWCHGVKCLVVNSQIWEDDSDAEEQRKTMDSWLDKELESAAGSLPPRIIVFSHIPPFIFRPDEDNGYFNLEPGLREHLLAKVTAKGAVGWFCGHYHRNAGGIYRDEKGRELEVVVTGAVGTQITDKVDENPLELSGIGGHCIGEEASGFRVVHVLPDRIEHEWKTFKDLKDSRKDEPADPPTKRPKL